MAVYINGTGIISPSGISEAGGFSAWNIPAPDLRFKCVEPDYGSFIDVKAIRRMSRIIKMGVTSSLVALKDARIERPEAIIVGTALGCLEDTVSFLNKLVINKEDLLNPTAFIHSTHNTIASQIALTVKCMGYNSTYVHRNISFETALLDGLLLLHEKTVNSVLVGGLDELTDDSFIILQRLGYFEKWQSTGQKKIGDMTSAGEGSAFFSLSNSKIESSYAKVNDVNLISFTSKTVVQDIALKMLKDNDLDKVDIVLNGNSEGSDYSELLSSLTTSGKSLPYKELCGEYPTASAFGMYLAAAILRDNKLPHLLRSSFGFPSDIRHILIHNNFRDVHHSLILLSAC